MQQFNQGQPYVQSNMGPQFQNMNQQGQYMMQQQGQYPMQQGQFIGQTPQYTFPGAYVPGKTGQLDQTSQQQTTTLQAAKNSSSENAKKPSQAQVQGQAQIQMMPNQQSFGGPAYYSGYPQGHLSGNGFPYSQQMGYNQGQNTPNMMYGNVQGKEINSRMRLT